MANKYKLIKEYPGSRKIGYVSDCCISDNSEHYLDGNWFNPALYPEYWEKINDVILKTEDGVDVKSDKCTLFAVGISANSHKSDYYKIKEYRFNGNNNRSKIIYKWFYYKSNAEHFIEENKPQFSKKDMIEFGKRCFTGGKNNAYNCSIEELLRMHFKK